MRGCVGAWVLGEKNIIIIFFVVGGMGSFRNVFFYELDGVHVSAKYSSGCVGAWCVGIGKTNNMIIFFYGCVGIGA